MGPLVRLLLDTCTFLWLVAEPHKLSRKAKEVIARADAELRISEASLMESAFRWYAGKIHLDRSPRLWWEEQLEQWCIEAQPISADVIFRAVELPSIHPDPFDRLIVATATKFSMPLVTPDKAIERYPVDVVW